MAKKAYDIAHFHMLFTEFITRMDSENAEDYDSLESPKELLDSPYGIFRYIATCTQFQMELLDEQLSDNIDIEPKICQKLSSFSEKVSKLFNLSIDCESL
jgi:hypothetical protein